MRALHSFPTRRSSDLSVSWVGAVGTCAGRRDANSFRSTGTTSSPSKSSCSNTVLRGRPAWSIKNSRSEEHTSELQSRGHLVCRLLLEKKKDIRTVQML